MLATAARVWRERDQGHHPRGVRRGHRRPRRARTGLRRRARTTWAP